MSMDQDDEWVRELAIPGIALPGLRALRIQFIALIEFDLMLGPVVYINELNKGSSYVEKLTNYQTLSEVYAGVARSPQHTLSTLEEDIAVFRRTAEGQTDITTVFFISCLPNTDLEPIRELGQKALFRSKGNPNTIGRELSLTLREKLSVEKKVTRKSKDSHFYFLDDNRRDKPLDYKYIKGLAIFDIGSKIVDIRNLARWIGGNEIVPKAFLQFVDNQLDSFNHGKSTSLLYQNIPFLGTKLENSQIYIVVHLEDNSFPILAEISHWFNPYAEILGNEWKLATQNEITQSLMIFEAAKVRKTPIKHLEVYSRMLIFSDRIKPIKGGAGADLVESPSYISEESWQKMLQLDGGYTISQLSRNWRMDIIDLVTLLEWARMRKIVEFLQ